MRRVFCVGAQKLCGCAWTPWAVPVKNLGIGNHVRVHLPATAKNGSPLLDGPQTRWMAGNTPLAWSRQKAQKNWSPIFLPPWLVSGDTCTIDHQHSLRLLLPASSLQARSFVYMCKPATPDHPATGTEGQPYSVRGKGSNLRRLASQQCDGLTQAASDRHNSCGAVPPPPARLLHAAQHGPHECGHRPQPPCRQHLHQLRRLQGSRAVAVGSAIGWDTTHG